MTGEFFHCVKVFWALLYLRCSLPSRSSGHTRVRNTHHARLRRRSIQPIVREVILVTHVLTMPLSGAVERRAPSTPEPVLRAVLVDDVEERQLLVIEPRRLRRPPIGARLTVFRIAHAISAAGGMVPGPLLLATSAVDPP